MRNPAVHWSEGMFLRPHHFQASDRFWNEWIANQIQFQNPYGYGLLKVALSHEALANGTIEFGGLRARWKDGSIIAQDENHIERVEFQERIEATKLGNEPVMVYLALPGFLEGQKNVAENGLAKLERFSGFRREMDEESEGGNRQEVGLRNLNLQVRFSTEDLAGYDVIPLVRLVRSQASDDKFVVDTGYFPPALSIQSWPELSGVVRAIFDVIGSRIQSLGDVIQQKSIGLGSQAPGDLEKILLLHALNEANAELSCLAFAEGVHPLVAYTALCRIVGRFSLFGEDMAIGQVPRYNHDDLATIFRWALERIRKLIYSVKEDEYEQRYFVGSGRGMQVSLEPEWFGLEWDWYFGVDPVNISRDECFQLLKTSIDWKLGSTDMVEKYMTLRMPGVKLRPVPQVPRALPSRGNWVFFQIRREEEAWKHVQVTQSMAMRVRSEQIANLDSLEGARRLRLSIDGNTYGLEFAVFAVRKRV